MAEDQIDETLHEIYTWLDSISFSRPRRSVARDFSDAVFMAELLKLYYPRHVELHNYTPASSLARKIDNWSTLNRKILTKIGLKLGNQVIYSLAKGQERVIEQLLIKLRIRILADCNSERKSLSAGDESSRVDSILDFDEIQNKKLPKAAFLKLQRELEEKSEHIETLNTRIDHLERLIKLKDQRIADLSTQITRLNHNRIC